jgi:hypothetical protein
MNTEGGVISKTGRTLVVLIGLLVGTLGAGYVLANGINPPQPRDSVTVKATCTTRTQQSVKEIFRARITGTESNKSLNLRIAGVVEEASIAGIKSIRFASSKVGNDGYLAARVVRQGAENGESILVQVKAGKTDLILVGFSDTGSAVRVRLSDCAAIDFSPSSNSSDPLPLPVRGL